MRSRGSARVARSEHLRRDRDRRVLARLPRAALRTARGTGRRPPMSSKPATVAEYLANLAPDRREALEAVRKVILKNLPKGYEEGIQYGMIGYYVPHRLYPAGYHANPKEPLPF